jgi:hypothetical protein
MYVPDILWELLMPVELNYSTSVLPSQDIFFLYQFLLSLFILVACISWNKEKMALFHCGKIELQKIYV